MRAWLLCTIVVAAACAHSTPGDDETRYLEDADFRRAALLASLVAPANGYSALRLAHYSTGQDGDWDRLAEWNPAVAPARSFDDAPLENASVLDVDAPLTELGREAFFRYPVQVVSAPPAAPSTYGLWDDGLHGLGGAVRFAAADGSPQLALTCASCHAHLDGATLRVGAPNRDLDLGAWLADANHAAEPLRSWGRGRLDVTTMDGHEPVRIADLRPVRFLSHLHADATVVQHDLVSLAIRIETLLTTSRHQALRPPRRVAFALATYVWSLADAAPPLPDNDVAGAALFGARCSGCHAGPGFTGAPVALDVVGTDPTVGLSLDRGTGSYRVPSLRFVSTRGPLLHDASLPTLDALFDPARLRDDYRGGTRAAGAVRGHAFGLDLSDDERRDLLTYLRAL